MRTRHFAKSLKPTRGEGMITHRCGNSTEMCSILLQIDKRVITVLPWRIYDLIFDKIDAVPDWICVENRSSCHPD